MALDVADLCVEYQRGLRVVDRVSLNVRAGEVVGVFGRNGAGKSSTFRAIFGLAPRTSGVVSIEGATVSPGLPSHKVAKLGATMVLEGRGIFAPLTVEENLLVAARGRDRAELLEDVWRQLPHLREKRRVPAGSLSGGEQQLLALARASLARPRLLIVDEPTLGLSPLATKGVLTALRGIAERGGAVLVSDQNIVAMADVCDRAYLMDRGRIQQAVDRAWLQNDLEQAERMYLGGSP